MPPFKEQNMETDKIRADRDSSSKRPLRYDKISLGGASHKQSDYPHDPARQFIQKQLEKAQMDASSSSGSKIVDSLRELEEGATREREQFQERSRETSDQKERRISNKRCNVIRNQAINLLSNDIIKSFDKSPKDVKSGNIAGSIRDTSIATSTEHVPSKHTQSSRSERTWARLLKTALIATLTISSSFATGSTQEIHANTTTALSIGNGHDTALNQRDALEHRFKLRGLSPLLKDKVITHHRQENTRRNLLWFTKTNRYLNSIERRHRAIKSGTQTKKRPRLGNSWLSGKSRRRKREL